MPRDTPHLPPAEQTWREKETNRVVGGEGWSIVISRLHLFVQLILYCNCMGLAQSVIALHKCRLNITVLVQSLKKTKNSSAKVRIVNGLVIEEANSAVTRLVSESAILKISQAISLTESPALAAVEDVAPLIEWPLKMVESMPQLDMWLRLWIWVVCEV